MTEPRLPSRSTTDQILDLLLDALAERQARRVGPAAPPPSTQPAGPVAAAREEGEKPTRPPMGESRGPAGGERVEQPARAAVAPPLTQATPPASRPSMPAAAPPPAAPPMPIAAPTLSGPLHLGRTLGRLCVLLAALVVVVNVPLSRGGLNLAHLVPSTASLIIRDGLVLKGSGPEIYVLQESKLRWISSLDAFDYFGYRWDQVHVVDDAFLNQFQKGAPLNVLLKCDASPHIYALENDHKRWIKDIATFTAQGYVWSDVKMVDCAYLRRLPDGPPIPEDAGTPPQP